MAEIKSYSLWLERIISSGAQASHAAGIPIMGFVLSDSRNPAAASSSGVGRGHVRFDEINLTVAAGGLAFAELSRAHVSGTNLGRGRIDALLSSGRSQHLLDFESTLIGSFSWLGRFAAESHFDLKLWIEKPRFLWHQ